MANFGRAAGSALSGAASGAAAGSTFGPWGAAAGGIIGGAAGGLSSLLGGDGDEERQKQLEILQQIQHQIDLIPEPELKEVVLEKYRSAGILTPEMEQVIAAGPSRMEQIKTDPRLKQAQLGALAKLQQTGAEGLTAEDRMVLNQVNREVAQQQKARQEGILQAMQQRGMGGAGAELAAQLSGAQAANEQQAIEAEKQAALSRQNALNAIMKSADLGSNIRQQDFGEQEKIAQAADLMNKFNTENARAVQQRNIASRNDAQGANLANRQDISNRNVGIENQQRNQANDLAQRRFDNALSKQRAKTGASQDVAKYYGGVADTEDKTGTAITEGVIKGIGSAADYFVKKKAGT